MKTNVKKNVYICKTESLCCAPAVNTTLKINYTSKTKQNKTKTKKPLKCLEAGFFFYVD